MFYTHPNGIAFRRVEASDLPDLTRLKNESWFGTHRVSFVSTSSQEKWLARLDAEDIHTPRNIVLVAIADRPVDMPSPVPASDDSVSANVGIFKVLDIDWQSRRAAVGWDVYRSHRRKGLGTKIVAAGVGFCFQVIGLHRLQADILVNNIASRKCASEAGFREEGYQPKTILRNGEWIDNIIYGILAPEKTC